MKKTDPGMISWVRFIFSGYLSAADVKNAVVGEHADVVAVRSIQLPSFIGNVSSGTGLPVEVIVDRSAAVVDPYTGVSAVKIDVDREIARAPSVYCSCAVICHSEVVSADKRTMLRGGQFDNVKTP